MFKKYVAKPVEIDAVLWKEPKHAADIPEYLKDIVLCRETVLPSTLSVVNTFYIKTLEGDMIVSDGDYIVKGILGEYYACKPEAFEPKYEER